MKTDEENNEWKAEAPYLAGLPIENPFLVPEQYFETLPEAITHSVYIDELKQVSTAPGYTVPDQYFSSLKDRILAQTSEEVLNTDEQYLVEAADESVDTAEILKRLPAAAGFSTPDQYFQQLQSKILAQTSEEAAPARASKIVRLWHSGLLKYASAACFILVAAFGFYLNQQTYKPAAASAAETANEQMLYDIDEQDIIDHVEGNVADEPRDKATNAELETYILNHYSQSELSSEL
jgi:hypothetical protein